MNRKISLIAAVADNGVIGKNGTLPWHLKKDFAWFIEKTIGKVVVMGRKNYEDIIRFTKGKPLKDRINVILTSQDIHPEGFLVVHSIADLFAQFPTEDLMIIGGTNIYEQFIEYANEFILTEIHHDFDGDVYFPIWDKSLYKKVFKRREIENNISYDFCIYQLKLNKINERTN